MSSGLLYLALESGQMDQIARLLEEDSSLIGARNASGQTPLHLLLAYSPDVNALTPPNVGGLAPLHVAARLNLPHMGQELIRAGADPNVRSQTAVPARPSAASASAAAAAPAPSAAAASASSRKGATGIGGGGGGGGKSTPLHECAKLGHLDFALWLLSIPGVDAAALDGSGFSPGYYAKKSGHAAMAKMLPVVQYDVWSQLESEPGYARNLGSIRAAIEKKEKLAQKKAEALEKKKKK